MRIADIGEILGLLPRRYPFLLIDRVLNIDGDQHGIGIKNLTVNENAEIGQLFKHAVMYVDLPAGVVCYCFRTLADATVFKQRFVHATQRRAVVVGN